MKALINHVWEKYDGDLDIMLSKDMAELRQELLSIYGIGEETADAIIVFAAGKPSFVIDSYTRRVVSRLGQAPEVDSYRAYQEVFHRALLADPALFNEFHALLDQHAKATCKKNSACLRKLLLESTVSVSQDKYIILTWSTSLFIIGKRQSNSRRPVGELG